MKPSYGWNHDPVPFVILPCIQLVDPFNWFCVAKIKVGGKKPFDLMMFSKQEPILQQGEFHPKNTYGSIVLGIGRDQCAFYLWVQKQSFTIPHPHLVVLVSKYSNWLFYFSWYGDNKKLEGWTCNKWTKQINVIAERMLAGILCFALRIFSSRLFYFFIRRNTGKFYRLQFYQVCNAWLITYSGNFFYTTKNQVQSYTTRNRQFARHAISENCTNAPDNSPSQIFWFKTRNCFPGIKSNAWCCLSPDHYKILLGGWVKASNQYPGFN